MSFTTSPASRKVFAVPPVEMISIPACARICANGTSPVLSETEISARWIFAMCGKNLAEIYPVRNSNRRRKSFCRRGRDHFLADGALEFCAGGVVIVQRLDLRRARLRERSLGVKHVELRAGAGVRARLGLGQRFVGFGL